MYKTLANLAQINPPMLIVVQLVNIISAVIPLYISQDISNWDLGFIET